MGKTKISNCALVLLLLASLTPALGQDIETRLSRMPRPWEGEKVHRVTLDEYRATMEYWEKRHPKILQVEVVERSAEGHPIYLLKITDSSVSNEDKQVALMTAMHGGAERSGSTTALHLAQWLLGDDPEAAEMRRRQVLLVMPIIDPYAFFEGLRSRNSAGIRSYQGGGAENWDLETLTYRKLDQAPEIKAFLRVVDQYQPDAYVDLHGTGLQSYPEEKVGDGKRYQGQTMFEVTGSAYSNFALRPWDWRISEAMIQAGLEAGYPSDRYEADAQRGFWIPGLDPLADRFWTGRPLFYTAQYAYIRYHTLLTVLEIGWEQSGVERVKGLLRLGNRPWQGEPYPGYPVDRVKSYAGHFMTSWGGTARERRRSRIELWEKQAGFTQAVLYPQTDGRDTYVVATDEKSAAILDPEPKVFLSNLSRLPHVDQKSIQGFAKMGPEILLSISKGKGRGGAGGLVQNGVGFRMRLPYRNPELLDIRLNGHLLKKSALDGYQSWYANGFTQVQIHVPPDKARKTGLFIVTVGYVPDVKREYGWTPPREVLESLGHGR